MTFFQPDMALGEKQHCVAKMVCPAPLAEEGHVCVCVCIVQRHERVIPAKCEMGNGVIALQSSSEHACHNDTSMSQL